ncbi:MAG TPA: COX15/CtaA family protein, partial [Casimicrobiaceae bacterium]|nr:COX15/CtaA family protein [Casimicrobiaceae bacterium]
AAHLLLAMLLIQVTLGIATLLLVVPLPLAALHQSGAVLLFAAALYAAHALRRQAGDSNDLLSAASGAMIDVPPRIERRD